MPSPQQSIPLKSRAYPWSPVHSRLQSLWHDRSGATAVEFALSLPVLALMFLGIVQFGGLFFLQNHMAGIAQDTARRIAVGALTTVTGKTFAEDALINWGVTYTVTADEVGTDVVVDISVPLAEASIFDIGGIFGTSDLQAEATMRRE